MDAKKQSEKDQDVAEEQKTSLGAQYPRTDPSSNLSSQCGTDRKNSMGGRCRHTDSRIDPKTRQPRQQSHTPTQEDQGNG